MSTETMDGALLAGSPKNENTPSGAESGPKSETNDIEKFEVNSISRVLQETIAHKFSGKLQEDIINAGHDGRREAVLQFKVDYLKHQLGLADAVLRTIKIIENNPDISANDLIDGIGVGDLGENERQQLLDVARDYEKQSQELRDLLKSLVPKHRQKVIREEIADHDEQKRVKKAEAKQALFEYLTGEKGPSQKFAAKRRGNNLIIHAAGHDFAQLYAGSTETGVRQALTKQAKGAGGFHRIEKLRHPTEDREVTFHTIVIRREYINEYGNVPSYPLLNPDELARVEKHEKQHAFDRHLDVPGHAVDLNFEYREDLKIHLSKLVIGYLEYLKDEAIAHAVEGNGNSLARAGLYSHENDFYFYPKKEQLAPYRKLLGAQKFKEWEVEKIWKENVVDPFRRASRDIARISARIASAREPQRAKLTALFEIEPAIYWKRLERWLDDEEVRKQFGKQLPKLAALPKKYDNLAK